MCKENKENETNYCESGKCHHHKEKRESRKIEIILYIISIILFILGFFPIFSKYKVLLYFVSILFAGYELIINGIKNIFHLNFEEDTLMTIAIIAAFILGEFPESCMVALLFKLGEFLEEKAVEGSNKSIKEIVEIKAKTANLINQEKIEIVEIDKLNIEDTILIKPGEIVPVDSKILKGTSNIDTSNITGESVEVFVREGDMILSGTMNLTGSIICKVEKDAKNSTVSQIVDLVYQATNNKGKTEKFITKFSKIYTPIVLCIALIVGIFVPFVLAQDLKEWLLRALVFLVASCPCSIVISVPLAFFSCIGKISKNGMLVKGTKHIEALSKAKQIAFDKTGTITTGEMEIEEVVSLETLTQEEIILYAYCLEKNSNHPISTAIKKEIEKQNQKVNILVENVEEIAGYGIKGKVEEKYILFGNDKLLKMENILIPENIQKANYLVVNGKIEGYIIVKEEIRKECKNIIENLKKVKIKNIIMLTGDNSKNAEKIAKQVGIQEVYSNLLPQDKLEKVKKLKEKGEVIFIGDGINDSPVLSESSFGISMGGGAEIANSIADGILISNNISSITNIIKIARKTMNIIKFNIIFSLIVKAIVLILGVLGYAPIWLAIVADTGVSLLTVLNSVRIIIKK